MASAMVRGRSSGSKRLISSWETTACTTAERPKPRINAHKISQPIAKAMPRAWTIGSAISFRGYCVALGRQNEVVLMQPFDLLRAQRNGGITPAEGDVGVLTFRLGQLADLLNE